VTPSGHEVATRQDIDEVLAVMNRRFESVDRRFEFVEQRFGAVDRFVESMEQSLAEQLEAMEHRISAAFERRIADAVSLQTRTLVLSQLGGAGCDRGAGVRPALTARAPALSRPAVPPLVEGPAPRVLR
jgi:hypothetical protein